MKERTGWTYICGESIVLGFFCCCSFGRCDGFILLL